ncbi:MAG: hypothetical protein HYR72_22460 [Deltaproteobacteria bacterium]|nr:hypothetical protein [Deltaproteobacteria bacterium]MBI3390612.1 hypothetical protein [Deltaproteobacteria bacterium]
MKQIAGLIIAVFLAACESSPPPEQAALAPVAPAAPAQPSAQEPAPPAAAVPQEPLPRVVAGLALGASLSDVQAKLGALDCHDNPEGFRVCSPAQAPADTPAKLEVYFVHDRVVSLAYESDVGANVWTFLNDHLARYGRPSLNGDNQTDKAGRTHEIYGWKDEHSIYSVRFVWQGEGAERRLTTTAIALWDRDAFQAWEAEKKAPPVPTPAMAETT